MNNEIHTGPTGLKRAIIVITVIAAAIMELIDTSIVNVALSQISGNLGATIEDTSWVITGYAIANVIIIPMTGFLARYFGRKNYYITSIIIFTISSYMCGQASSLISLVLWRFLQGIGGGALLSTSQGILFDAFEIKKRPMASAIFGMGIVLGPAIGPTLGGVIIDNYSWPLIFYINIPIGILAAVLAYTFIDKKPEEFSIDRKSIKIDYVGILALIIGVASLQYFLERGETDDWFESKTITAMAITAFVGLATFIIWELRTKTPVINLHVLKNRNLAVSNILTFTVGFGMFSSVFIFPVLAQRVLGFTPTETGIGLIPAAATAILVMPFIGRGIQGGVPPVVFVVLGFIFFILHGYTGSQANLNAGNSFFFWPNIFRGLGTAMLTVPLINQAVSGLKPQEMPSGISLTNMIRQLGGSVGIAVMNTFIVNRMAVHRSDLISNLQPNDPELIARVQTMAQGAIAKGGASALGANNAAYKMLDGTIMQQSALQSYLDAFLLISVFFIATSPFLLLTQNKKVSAETMKKVAEESH
ncbi:MAG TPA: DHA2 family efflux MFS transporter permease subunit [Bacteroidia bacterium]|nr:DHA2 family efflux MFS transporter permease subunit [Bacteroidia bacterium]